MSIHLVLPKLSNIILNKFCVKQITVSAILAHMTFYSTSVANSVLNLDEGAIDLILVLLSITNLLSQAFGGTHSRVAERTRLFPPRGSTRGSAKLLGRSSLEARTQEHTDLEWFGPPERNTLHPLCGVLH